MANFAFVAGPIEKVEERPLGSFSSGYSPFSSSKEIIKALKDHKNLIYIDL